MRIGKAAATEIRHRVGLAPDNVVQQPEIKVLDDAAKPVDVVIAANDPERAIRFQDAARLGKPGAAESVIGGEAVELVPVVLDTGNGRLIGAGQVAAKLQIVGRVGKHQIHRGGRKLLQLRKAITLDHNILFHAFHPLIVICLSAPRPFQETVNAMPSQPLCGCPENTHNIW